MTTNCLATRKRSSISWAMELRQHVNYIASYTEHQDAKQSRHAPHKKPPHTYHDLPPTKNSHKLGQPHLFRRARHINLNSAVWMLRNHPESRGGSIAGPVERAHFSYRKAPEPSSASTDSAL
eukprot:CAMPEP_0206561688 /NCGR_PEP_ID=MMETSP0325_2-20121206/21767_1 /ASSEMBLY_ACC=CAM_ASM_000347 /TAXON_ID=2866 /ORGANISM="Crypthecodinium cohnii, Strain Seligo" /LENGTH=121 /DNA_ID=CAMNT_0054063685 /DNA_START=30 /DNA_END=395 /DNA_ORIENTATION=-